MADSRAGKLLDRFDLELASLPSAVRGLRVLQLSDLHLRRMNRLARRVIDATVAADADLVAITGDLIEKRGQEEVGLAFLRALTGACRPRLGFVGVFGNHDTPELRKKVDQFPIRWLVNQAWRVQSLPMTVYGVDCRYGHWSRPGGDLLGAVADEWTAGRVGQGGSGEEHRFRLLLAHMPSWLVSAADVSMDLVLSGHTHGGQCRLPGGRALVNATLDWPIHLTSGLMLCGRTHSVVSRGLGESDVAGLRVWCPRHAPLITLKRAERALPPTQQPICLRPW